MDNKNYFVNLDKEGKLNFYNEVCVTIEKTVANLSSAYYRIEIRSKYNSKLDPFTITLTGEDGHDVNIGNWMIYLEKALTGITSDLKLHSTEQVEISPIYSGTGCVEFFVKNDISGTNMLLTGTVSEVSNIGTPVSLPTVLYKKNKEDYYSWDSDSIHHVNATVKCDGLYLFVNHHDVDNDHLSTDKYHIPFQRHLTVEERAVLIYRRDFDNLVNILKPVNIDEDSFTKFSTPHMSHFRSKDSKLILIFSKDIESHLIDDVRYKISESFLLATEMRREIADKFNRSLIETYQCIVNKQNKSTAIVEVCFDYLDALKELNHTMSKLATI